MEPSNADVVRPRSVLVADDDLYMRIEHDSENVGLLEDVNAMILPYSGRAELNAPAVSSVHSLLQNSGQLVAGALLIRNPYEAESYEMSEDAIESFSIAKYHAFANVSRLLGAKQVRFLEAKAESQDESWQAKLAAMLPSGGGDSEVVRDVAKKLEDRLSGNLTFEGGSSDPEAARDYLRRSYLTHDPQLRALVEMRDGHNLMTRYEFTLSGTRESAANFSSALNIANSGPVKAVDIGVKFAKTVNAIRDVEFKTEIEF